MYAHTKGKSIKQIVSERDQYEEKCKYIDQIEQTVSKRSLSSDQVAFIEKRRLFNKLMNHAEKFVCERRQK